MGSEIALPIDKSIFFKKNARFLAYVHFLLYLCTLFCVMCVCTRIYECVREDEETRYPNCDGVALYNGTRSGDV